MRTQHHYTDEEKDFIRQNYHDCNSHAELTCMFNEQFGTSLKVETLRDYCHKKLGLKGMPNGGQYRIGGKSRDLPLGTIRKVPTATYIKIGNNDTHLTGYKPPNWMPLQQYIWEQKFGPIPKNHFVIFLDGNTENFDISNLAVINRRISAQMAINRFYTENTELTRAGLMCIELKEHLKNKRRGD